MRKFNPILLSVTVLLILSLACVLPSVPGVPAPTQDLNALGTIVMATMVSGATQTAQAVIPIQIVDTTTPLPPTSTAEPTFTPTITLTPTPVFTNTPTVPQISVSVATNCRVGPGKVYDRVGALLVGQVSEVVGRNQVGNYWYISNPNRAGGFCWLWGEYATVTGNLAALPVYTPPPTPTPMPSFYAEYDRLDNCTGWWVEIELINDGGLTFESVAVTVRDTATNVVVSQYADTFTDLDSCSYSSTTEAVKPGTSPNLSSPQFGYDPRGHELAVTVTLCSRDGQNGTCLTDSFRVTP
jgi:hypothetical protein